MRFLFELFWPIYERVDCRVVRNFYLNFFGPCWSYILIKFTTLPSELRKYIYDKVIVVESCPLRKDIYIYIYIYIYAF